MFENMKTLVKNEKAVRIIGFVGGCLVGSVIIGAIIYYTQIDLIEATHNVIAETPEG